MLSILAEAGIKLGKPLCVDVSFENTPNFVSVASILIALGPELAQKTHLHRFVDVHSNAIHQLRLIGRVGQKQTDKVSDFIDRKSTRLNSSHVAISYAVFCLKKKTKI